MNNNTKEKTFVDISREIADNFIRDIVFVDERAYPKKTDKTVEENVHNNEFDSKAVSDAFLKKGKICAIYAPQTEEDIQECISSLIKADVVVLDWDLKLTDTSNFDPMADDESEKRGQYTKSLIKKLVDYSGKEKVKLIIIYTGETDVEKITGDIHKYIQSDEYVLNNSTLCVQNSNLKIIVRAKEGAKVVEHHKDKIIEYNKLPELITIEFATLTMGLLPNYALSAITAIRDNTSNILGVFSKDIDPAFLGHYVSISDCNDAISMLSEIFGSAITDLIDSSNFNIKTWIDKWLTQKGTGPFETKIGNNKLNVSGTVLKNIVNSSELSFKTKLKNAGFSGVKGNDDELKRDATKLFIEHSDMPNYKLAKLIQHSNLFSPSKAPRLTTGTIVKYKGENDWSYLLCIQQRCDSVRIPKEGRTFLFLPLTQNTKGTAVVVGEMKHMIVKKESHSVELHEFIPENDKESSITAKQYEQIGYAFKDKTGKYYIWVAELKEMFAQNIVTTYASQLSRVGIDDSEWIRLVGKMN